MALISLNNLERFFNNLKTYISNALNSKANTSHTHTKSEITDFPTIPTVNNATLTIQKNGTTVKTFTANASSNVTANITVPTKTSDLTNDSGFLTSHQDLSGYIPKSGGQVFTGGAFSRTSNATYLELNGGTDWNHGAGISLRGKDCNTYGDAGCFLIKASDGTNDKVFTGRPNGALYWGSKNVAMQEDVIPRSGGAVMSGNLFRTTDDNTFVIGGGTAYDTGASIYMRGSLDAPEPGWIYLAPRSGIQTYKYMILKPDGSLTWNGQTIQTSSDQRLKQQISQIDGDLLTAWEDVDLVQFKYNDAVKEKSDNARLHTGYVVQQIDDACKKHNVDISAYGLYCHEEYPERTEEVEVEQEDGTTKKETKVIEEASEHYSLRYTEALIVECAYLRKCIKELKEEIKELKNKD